MVKSYIIAKYAIFVVVVVSAGFAIERFTRFRNLIETAKLVAHDIPYNGSEPLVFNKMSLILKSNHLQCILQPSRPFCAIPSAERRELFQKEQKSNLSKVEIMENKLEYVTSKFKERRRHMYNLMAEFINIISTVHAKAFIIEPSILFCMLPLDQKKDMLYKGFNPNQQEGSGSIATFGVFEEDTMRLSWANITGPLQTAGFTITKIQIWLKRLSDQQNQLKSFQPVHYLLTRDNMTLHVVVFYRIKSYLWMAGLDYEKTSLGKLLFANEQIFENFSLKTMIGPSLGTISNKVLIPHYMQYFLKETKTSKFVECQSSTTSKTSEHTSTTTEYFDIRVAVALRELKSVLVPKMVVFWLWSQSYLGWFQECNILHYSPTLHLALLSTEVQMLNLTEILSESSFLTISNYSQENLNFEYLVDCRGLQINLVIMYEERGGLWTKHKDGENVYRLLYPAFSICSADIYGQKENVPCNADFMRQKEKHNWVENERNTDEEVYQGSTK